ncbi:hypothetical protein PZ938_13275 [Luteipulveratus sp. YIM 133132]|nr:hypothetical protein [Luteipulveratus sp. YIM 133132]MDE9366578.1 hypothetical protein [Luteipulveratus sp. YIM 133132]
MSDPTSAMDGVPSPEATIWFMDKAGSNRQTAGVHGIPTSWRSGG